MENQTRKLKMHIRNGKENMFKKKEQVLISRNVTMSTRLRLLKCYVPCTLLHCCKCWTISKAITRTFTRLQKCGFITECSGSHWATRFQWRDRNRKPIITTTTMVVAKMTNTRMAIIEFLKCHMVVTRTAASGIDGKRSRWRRWLTFMDRQERECDV